MAMVEVTEQGWFSRILSSIVGALLGIALLAAAFPVLFWNEGRAVETSRSLEEGQAAVVDASADKVDAQNEHRLVHVSGATQTSDVLRDPDFGVKVSAVRLARNAEIYEWEQRSRSDTRKKLGGGEETVTTYTYEKTWADHVIPSGGFKESGHDNPQAMPFPPRKFEAEHVTLGTFHLIPAQISKIGGGEALDMNDAPFENAAKRVAPSADGTLFLGASASDPKIGDQRIRFQVVKPGPLSVIAQQVGDSFAPYPTKAGRELLLVADGAQTAQQMFQTAQTENTVWTWLLRAGGLLLMFFGLALVFKPLSVLGDVIPFVGTLIGAGLGVFAFLISLALSLLTVSFAWLFYRPLVGVPLLLLGLGALYLVFTRGRRQKGSQGLAATTS
jgi:hypothetical protein